MKKHNKKLLSTVAVAAVVVSAVPAFAAEEVAVAEGLYINVGETKYYFTTDELFSGEHLETIADLINEAGLENVFFVQDGTYVTAEGAFENADFAELEENIIPTGEYAGTDGNSVTVGTPETPGLTVESVSAINATTLSVTLSDETVHEVTLETALEANVATEVTFEIDGVEYTATVTYVEEVVAPELTVESVSAINPTSVTVVVSELTGDIEGATVEVKDSNGNIVEVEATDFSAGETELEFAFVDEVDEDDLVGVWTVDGVSIDLDLVAALEIFESTNSEIELYEILSELGIENLVPDNADEYSSNKADFLDELDEEEAELTVEAIQAYVNEVNAEALTDAEVQAAIEALVDAIESENAVKVKAALSHAAFLKVNPNWIEGASGYVTAFGAIDDETELEDIQVAIYAVNEARIGVTAGAVDLTDNTEIDKVLNLIAAYAEVDEDGEYSDAITTTLETLEEQKLVNKVLAATTASKFKLSVTALAEYTENEDLVEEYVDGNGKDYIDHIATANAESLTIDDTATILAAIQEVNLKVIAEGAVELFADLVEASGKVVEAGDEATSTQKSKLVTALKEVGIKQVSSNSANVAEYVAVADDIEGAATLTLTGDETDAELEAIVEAAIDAIQALIDVANIAVVDDAEDKTELLEALKVLELDNLIAANDVAYFDEVDGEDLSALDVDDIQDIIDTINEAVAIDTAVEAINEAETATEVKVALDTLVNNGEIASYLNVTSADRIFIAEKVLEDRDELEADRDEDAVAKEFVDATEVAASVNGAITERAAALAAVNAITSELVSGEVETVELTGDVTETTVDVEVTPAQKSITDVTVNFDAVEGPIENVTATVKYDGESIGTKTIDSIADGATSVTITLDEAKKVAEADYDELLITVELTYGTEVATEIPVTSETPTVTDVEAQTETQVNGFEVSVDSTEAVTGATLTVYNSANQVVATDTVDLAKETNTFTVNLDSNLAADTYTAKVTYDETTQAANDLVTIANALLLVGHDSLSEDTPASNTLVAEKFFNVLTFDDENGGVLKPKFTSISAIRTVLDGLQ